MKQRFPFMRLAAMILCICLLLPLAACGAASSPAPSGSTSAQAAALKKLLAEAPKAYGESLSAEEFVMGDAYQEWAKGYEPQLGKARAASSKPFSYYSALMKQLLVSEDENTVCSPLNTFFAFAMLAETAGGNSRRQLLDMLGAESIEELEETFAALWDANNLQTPIIKSLLAGSLWLSDREDFSEETLQKLTELYHASSFRGTPGSEEMDKALQDWTNEATGGLLEEYVKDLKLDPGTVLAILSALYFKTEWLESFHEEQTVPQTFRGAKGDTTVRMMQQNLNAYLLSDHFTGVSLPLIQGGAMYCFLPDEGTDVNALLDDPDVLKAVSDPDSPLRVHAAAEVHLPRFKVQAKADLLPVMEALGATDVLDAAKSDFTPLIPGSSGLFVGTAEHAAAVEIDESGLTGAAYTVIMLEKGEFIPQERIDIVFDRPFLFIVTAADGSIIFAGAVRNVAE